ncbi:MAG: DMT family transporter [Pseudomonadota bacterium]
MTTEPRSAGPDNIRGIAWALLSVVTSSVMTVTVRAMTDHFSPSMTLALRAGLSVILLVVLAAAMTNLRHHLRFTLLRAHLLRGLCIGVSTLLGFYTIAHIPLATATVLFFTAPIFAVIIAATVQGEPVGPRRWSAVIAGFVGALIILRPGFDGFEPAMLAALGSSVFFATALTMSRQVAGADGPIAAFASSVVVTVIFATPFALPDFALPGTLPLWALALLLVATGGARNIADIQAYRYGDAGVVGPIAYLRLVLIGAAGFVLFGEVPDGPTLVGAVIIIASAFYIARREAQLSKARAGGGP